MADVLTTAQANSLHGRSAVRHRLATGRWQRPTRGVIVTHSGPLTADQRERVVLAACPPGSALAGLTAATRLGLRGFEPSQVHVVLPSGAKRPSTAAVVHWSTMLGTEDVPANRSPRMTSLERSVIDAASWASTKQAARVLVIAAFQQRLTNVRRMRDALSRRGPCRHRAVIIQSILDAAGGIQSLPERDFDEIRLLAGLPRPSRQVRAEGQDHRYYLDVWWEESHLAVEIHGIPHLAVEQWSDDLHRTNELVIDGRRVLVFSSFAIRHQRDLVIDQLRRAARP
ncbi:hypothetical protein [Aeromicrobium choanae]|uniref:DUF559 domain-containing protein n=1 Tax=Aeromicrobium choanae TaxID=1736691 RepID=A0A1T4YPI2_9ACTN|nr:hypothetical protein [Aeromicrobium choanae]SKB03171.1 hypothetical protein SAMN06295964_0168 [Aeromicrobium choanae]